MESLESFAGRVLARTGVSLNDLPRRVARDGEGMGHIMCARASTFVCAVGYPSHVDDDGSECYDQFELVLAR